MTIICPCCNGTLPWRHYTTDESGRTVEMRCFCGHTERREND